MPAGVVAGVFRAVCGTLSSYTTFLPVQFAKISNLG
jgi:hypothetical protein